jgi:hypothetical protein
MVMGKKRGLLIAFLISGLMWFSFIAFIFTGHTKLFRGSEILAAKLASSRTRTPIPGSAP